jgi:hypothetical protein
VARLTPAATARSLTEGICPRLVMRTAARISWSKVRARTRVPTGLAKSVGDGLRADAFIVAPESTDRRVRID